MYIVEYKENNVVIGYLNAKRSRKAKPIVTDIKQATRLPYARALDAAGRYNGMHAGTGKAAHVIVAPADTDPFRHYMRRAGRPLGTADLDDGSEPGRAYVAQGQDRAPYVRRAVVALPPAECRYCGKSHDRCTCD